MSILSSANSGKYSIPISEDTLLKNHFYCALGKDVANPTFVASSNGINGIYIPCQKIPSFCI